MKKIDMLIIFRMPPLTVFSFIGGCVAKVIVKEYWAISKLVTVLRTILSIFV